MIADFGSRGLADHGILTAAPRIGVSVEEYRRQLALGNKWCSGHRRWCPLATFARVWSVRRWRVSSRCREADRAASREYQRRKRETERQFAPAPDGRRGFHRRAS